MEPFEKLEPLTDVYKNETNLLESNTVRVGGNKRLNVFRNGTGQLYHIDATCGNKTHRRAPDVTLLNFKNSLCKRCQKRYENNPNFHNASVQEALTCASRAYQDGVNTLKLEDARMSASLIYSRRVAIFEAISKITTILPYVRTLPEVEKLILEALATLEETVTAIDAHSLNIVSVEKIRSKIFASLRIVTDKNGLPGGLTELAATESYAPTSCKSLYDYVLRGFDWCKVQDVKNALTELMAAGEKRVDKFTADAIKEGPFYWDQIPTNVTIDQPCEDIQKFLLKEWERVAEQSYRTAWESWYTTITSSTMLPSPVILLTVKGRRTVGDYPDRETNDLLHVLKLLNPWQVASDSLKNVDTFLVPGIMHDLVSAKFNNVKAFKVTSKVMDVNLTDLAMVADNMRPTDVSSPMANYGSRLETAANTLGVDLYTHIKSNTDPQRWSIAGVA